MSMFSVYITAKDVKEARAIAHVLVMERLLACANIIPKIESVYWWSGKMQRHGEAAIIGKSKAANKNRIIKRVKELHSYKVPCIVFWSLAGGNKDFLAWINKETRKVNKK